MSIDPKYLPYLQEMRGLAQDSSGRSVLVGLTADETDEYFDLLDTEKTRRLDMQERDRRTERYLRLHEIHEGARRQVLLAEVEKRVDKPTSH